LIDGNLYAIASSFDINGLADFKIDLGSATDLGAVGIAGANPTIHRLFFKVFLSSDGITWRQVAVDFPAAYTIATTNATLDFLNNGYADNRQLCLGYDAVTTDRNTRVYGDGSSFQLSCFETNLYSSDNVTKLGIVAFAQTQNARYIRFTTYGNDAADSNYTFSNLTEVAAFGPNTVK
jgi:hypothetical protein